MVKEIFFNSSLPRSGSTLLQNILMQNSLIYSTPTSGLVEFMLTARQIYSNSDAFKAQPAEQKEKAFQSFCRSGMIGYFDALTDRPFVIDKSRAWLGDFRFLNFFYPGAKMIVMVRDLRGVFSSMEKNFRKNPQKDPMIVNGADLQNMTTDSRLKYFSSAPPIGPSLEWIYESLHQGFQQHILFLRYEDLVSDPQSQMNIIYDYLKLDRFNHDFNNIRQLTYENDEIHGIFGDHKIKPKLEPLIEDWEDILGLNNCDLIINHYKWFYEAFGYNVKSPVLGYNI